jgi:O-antigen/teichoic acid export membrane protein
VKLWRSGIVYSALSFLGGLGNLAFVSLIGHTLSEAEVGATIFTLNYIDLLTLPLAIVGQSLTHYVAHFRAHDDEARLQGLIAGYQKFLLHATIAVSILAVVAAVPLSRFFDFRPTLMMAAIGCVLVGFWSGYAVALCQGMAWFKRTAIIGLLVVVMRLAFGWVMTSKHPSAEIAVTATTFSLLANLALFIWRKDIVRSAQQTSPWDRDFVRFMVVAGACLGATYLLTKGDTLVANKYFEGKDKGFYAAAERLALALISTVAPMLTVVFTSRSGKRNAEAALDQRVLLLLYGAGLAIGAAAVLFLKDFLVRLIFHHPSPESAAMVTPLTIAMVFVGLAQAIGMWALASRWFGLAMLYGAVGLAYWLTLLMFGKTPAELLKFMPIAAAVAFAILCFGWLLQLKREGAAKQS